MANLMRKVWNYLIALTLMAGMVRSVSLADAPSDRYQVFTRGNEFDFVSWTLDALGLKSAQAAWGLPRYLPERANRDLVLQDIYLVSQMNRLQRQIEIVYADPKISQPETTAAPLLAELQRLTELRQTVGPLAETVLQQQVGQILAENGLSVGGQPLPPVLYHITPLPLALIISPRDKILQETSFSLLPGLTLDQMVQLEQQEEQRFNVSALVTEVGGVGTYPTMVMSINDLPYLIDTIAHEWTHNYLTLRPLGWQYETNGELRTMNETTASIVGNEIGQQVLKRYYPEYLPPEETKPQTQPAKPNPTDEEPRFDYRKEMHITRLRADELLAAGKIDEAEAYMEARREVFWNNGYLIRRLNQAFFAFHGAYADQPGGAAGQDPVGPAVRALREQSGSLEKFLKRIAWMTTFEQLQKAIEP